MFEGARVLSLFVPGKVRRQDNGSQGSWKKKAGYRKGWRNRIKVFLLSSGYRLNKIPPETPKTIRLRARVFNLFDSDGLEAALKPTVDGLVDSGVINSDKPEEVSGHRILKSQLIDRKIEGVLIYVNLGVESSLRDLPGGQT